MPLIDVQRRIARTGAIRLGNRVPTGGTDRRGNPRTRPNKLETFRVTSPHRAVIEAVASLYGGTVQAWRGPSGPEFEVVTPAKELPVLVPPQQIDPNYELWGNKVRMRMCDGRTERIRSESCLCERFANHDHAYWQGVCTVCGLRQGWAGPGHEHHYEYGYCTTCGCRRPCKPTTRVNVMIRGVPAIGVFKVESHGFHAAAELTGLADMITRAPVPLPGMLGMRLEDQAKLVVNGDGERTESRKFWVPEIRFDWLTPDMAYTGSARLEQAARAQIAASDRTALAIEAAPADDDEERLTVDDVKRLIREATNLKQVQQLWRDAHGAGVLDDELSRLLTAKADDFPVATSSDETVDGEVVEEDWPEVRPAGTEPTP